MPESLKIDAPSASLALSLVECLAGFGTEVSPRGGERFQVEVDLDGDGGGSRRLLDGLGSVERWLESSGLDLADVHLNGRSYRLERRTGIPLPTRVEAEVDRLVCRIRTIPLGTGVQVVSADGELDLFTAGELEKALESTTSPRVILDLTEAPFMDSTAVQVIVRLTKRMRGEGRQLLVAAGNPTASRVLSITGLDRALSVRPSLAEAIAWALDGSVNLSGE